MLSEPQVNQVYLAFGATDVRKFIDGLAVLVKERFELAPLQLQAKIKWYEEQIRLGKQKQYGASTGWTPPEQLL